MVNKKKTLTLVVQKVLYCFEELFDACLSSTKVVCTMSVKLNKKKRNFRNNKKESKVNQTTITLVYCNQ